MRNEDVPFINYLQYFFVLTMQISKYKNNCYENNVSVLFLFYFNTPIYKQQFHRTHFLTPTSQINVSASPPQYLSSTPVSSDYLECRRVASRKRCVPISVRPGGTSLSRSPWGSKVSRPRVPCSKASPILRRAFWTRNVREVSRKRRPAKVAHLRRIGDGIYISRRSEYHRTRIL